MSLASRLRPLLPQGQLQKALAISWLQKWKETQGSQQLRSDTTVESRLSDLLSDKVQGARFFFCTPERSNTTFAAFEISSAHQPELLRLAKEAIDDAEPTGCRILVDLSGPSPQAAAAQMFASFKQTFLGEDAVWPVMLLLNEEQYDAWPRSFDSYHTRLVVTKVPNEQAAQVVVDGLADSGALIVSPRPQRVFERWAALRIGTELKLEPENALATFRDEGRLDALPAVTRPLDKVAPPEEYPLPNTDPLAVRCLMRDLACGVELRGGSRWGNHECVAPGRRVAWAKALGITASASKSEWDDSLPKRIAPARVLDAHHADYLMAIAHFVHVPATGFTTSDGLVLLNPEPHMRAEVDGLERVTVRDIAPTRGAILDAFFGDVSRLTNDQIDDDPYLFHLVGKHAQEAADVHALELARATLLNHKALPRARLATLATWQIARTALQMLLHQASPAANLRLIARETRRYRESCALIVSDGAVPELVEMAATTRLGFDPLAPLTVRRTESLRHVVKKPGDEPPAAKTPLGRDASQWAVEFLEDLSRCAEQRINPPATQAHHATITKFAIPESLWHDADRQLAFVTLALRRAVECGEGYLLPSGAFLVALNAGLFAELLVRPHSQSVTWPTEAALDVYYNNSVGNHPPELDSLTRLVPTFQARSGHRETEVGPQLPSGVRFAGHGYRVDVNFVASGLYVDPPAGTTRAGVASGVTEMMEQQRRADEAARNDDDD